MAQLRSAEPPSSTSELSRAALNSLLSVTDFGERGSARTRKLAVWAMALSPIVKAGVSQWKARQARRSYTVSVTGDDQLYDEVQRWLLEQMSPEQRRALVARTASVNELQAVEIGGGRRRRATSVGFFYDRMASHTVELEGHAIEVGITRGNGSIEGVNVNLDSGGWGSMRRFERIVFTCPNRAAQEAVGRFGDVLPDAPRPVIATDRAAATAGGGYGAWPGGRPLGRRRS